MVQVAWQAYMSRVSYDSPQQHHSFVTTTTDNDALDEPPLLLRGGAGEEAAEAGAARDEVVPVPVAAVGAASIRRRQPTTTVVLGRRLSCRYAYMDTATIINSNTLVVDGDINGSHDDARARQGFRRDGGQQELEGGSEDKEL